jgi:hypothetical protein
MAGRSGLPDTAISRRSEILTMKNLIFNAALPELGRRPGTAHVV